MIFLFYPVFFEQLTREASAQVWGTTSTGATTSVRTTPPALGPSSAATTAVATVASSLRGKISLQWNQKTFLFTRRDLVSCQWVLLEREKN